MLELLAGGFNHLGGELEGRRQCPHLYIIPIGRLAPLSTTDTDDTYAIR
jgi:hypothetical protein